MARKLTTEEKALVIINKARDHIFVDKLLSLCEAIDDVQDNEEWDKGFKEICETIGENFGIFESMVESYHEITFEKVKEAITNED